LPRGNNESLSIIHYPLLRPYLAILVDAFREALASRVLWVLLLISAIVLVGLAGFTLDEQASSTIYAGELPNPREFAAALQRASERSAPSPGKRVWELLPEETRAKLAEQLLKGNDQDAVLLPLQAALNRLLQNRQLSETGNWPLNALDAEGNELLAEGAGKLPAVELARLNRLLLEAAFPRDLAPSRERELVVHYYGLEVPTGAMPPLRRDYLIRAAVGTISSFFLGYLGLFAGIIVTSNVIPQTFEPGAVDLLLSKPVNRMGVYLSKFFGGCLFVLLNTTLLLGGMWLLTGFRHGVWIHSLVLCIPVFLFWFMVFFSISALVGLIWRNSIVAVCVTIGVWGLCAVLSFVKNQVIEAMILDPARLTRIVPARGGELFAAADTGQVLRWNSTTEHWDEILVPDDPRRWRAAGTGLPAGPVYDPAALRLDTVQRTGRRWNSWAGATTPLVSGEAKNQFRRIETNIAPAGSILLARDRREELLCVGSGGIFGLKGDPLATPATSGTKLLGFDLPLPNAERAQFQPLSEPQRWVAPLAASYDKANDRVAVFQRATLQLFERDGRERFVELRQRNLPEREHGAVALAGETIMLAYEDGTFAALDTATLEVQHTEILEPAIPARFLEASPDGAWVAALLHDRSVWLYECAPKRWTRAAISGNGDASAIGWDATNQLWVVTHGKQAAAYDPRTGEPLQDAGEPADWLQLLDRLVLKPAYAVLPKTGETWNLVNYLLTDQRTVLQGSFSGGLRSQRTPLDLRTPLIGHALWIVGLLAIGCWVIQRRDY
jgi:hypothetical protein